MLSDDDTSKIWDVVIQVIVRTPSEVTFVFLCLSSTGPPFYAKRRVTTDKKTIVLEHRKKNGNRYQLTVVTKYFVTSVVYLIYKYLVLRTRYQYLVRSTGYFVPSTLYS